MFKWAFWFLLLYFRPVLPLVTFTFTEVKVSLLEWSFFPFHFLQHLPKNRKLILFFFSFLCLVYSSCSNVHYFRNLETNANSSKSKANSSLLLSGSAGRTVTSSHSQWESYRSGLCAPVYKSFAFPVEDGFLWIYLYQLLNFELSIQFPHSRVRLTLCCVTINYWVLGNLFTG